MVNKYGVVTETPGTGASKEQLERAYQRYHFAYQFCGNKDVLEVACGAGQGLGYLAKTAKKVIGGDIDEDNLMLAKRQYAGRNGIELKNFDAEDMPFENSSFDIVIMYEAIYYLRDAAKFISEACRVLKNKGQLIICTVNKDWSDFNPSAFSVRYFSVLELNLLLNQKFDTIKFYGGFSTAANGVRDMFVSLSKRAAVAMHLIPRTMTGKELLKRLFFGKLYPLPSEIKDGTVKYIQPVLISADLPNSHYKVIYATAKKKG